MTQFQGGSLDNLTTPTCSAFYSMNATTPDVIMRLNNMRDFLMNDQVGQITTGTTDPSYQEVMVANMTGDMLEIGSFLNNLTTVSYSEFNTVLSDNYRLFLVEN